MSQTHDPKAGNEGSEGGGRGGVDRPVFLSVQDVMELHRIEMERKRGAHGLRDFGLLDSAVALPAQQAFGAFLHEDVAAMAAAYAFGIVRNHPFLDGNKRAGLSAMLAFLIVNGWRVRAESVELAQVILEVAEGSRTKESLTSWVRERLEPRAAL